MTKPPSPLSSVEGAKPKQIGIVGPVDAATIAAVEKFLDHGGLLPGSKPFEAQAGVEVEREEYEREKERFGADLTKYADMCEIAGKNCDANAFNAGWLAARKRQIK